ncbi:DPOA2 polymerase, partial [Furnarius figulus]|nr:DPOA2 polymerase [Furnarius figulus]
QGPHKRRGSPPVPPRAKRAPASRSPFSVFSPGSFSPGATPSPKYSCRGGRGEVVVSFGAVQGLSWRGRGGAGVAPKPFGDPARNLPRPYKFMFQKALDVREALAWRMEELGEALRQHHGLEGFASAVLPVQEPVVVLGQVCCDGLGRLNAQSVLLAGDLEHSAGREVPLDLSELQEYSLFPGQIVALQGINSTGKKMVVSKLYEV